MKKRTIWLRSVVLLLVCVISAKELNNDIGWVTRRWRSRAPLSESPDMTATENLFLHSEIFADEKPAYAVGNLNQDHFPNPCFGSLYPTPAEGKLVQARVSGIEFSMFVYDHGSVKDIVSDSIKTSGSWETRDTQMLMNLMKCASSDCQNRVFLDVGANIGWYSLTAANLGFSVISFEPFGSNLGLICSSIRESGESNAKRITIFNVGLDFKPRHCELFQQRSVNVGDTHSVCDGASRSQFIEKGYAPLGWMNTTTLDLALEAGYFEHVDHVDVMKVDVEGFEYSVMEGGNQFFQSFLAPKYIFMEL